MAKENRMKINKKLAQLIKLLYQSQKDNIPFPTEKLLGDWDDVQPGRRVTITFVDPYRVEHGTLMVLPGIHADDMLKGGIVHIADSTLHPNKQAWYVLKYIAIFAETVELEPLL